MNNNIADFEERKKIWISFANLFLDTDVSLFYESIIKSCSESKYSLSELEYILKREVAPAFAFNLYNISGEWVSFDEAWLVNRISKYIANGKTVPGFFKNILNRITVRTYVNGHWRYLSDEIEEMRETQNEITGQ